MGDFINQIKTLFSRTKDNNENSSPTSNKEKESPKKESVASFSMNEGDHGKIFGVSRKVVSGILIVIITIFAIAFITATSDTPKQDRRAAADLENEKPASDGTNTMTGLPQSYGNYLNNPNFQQGENKHGGNQQNRQNTNKAEEERRRLEEQRRRAEREAAALQNANRPSAASQAVQTPNYLAQQQAQYAAQLQALNNAQNGHAPQQAGGSNKNQTIQFSLSSNANNGAVAAGGTNGGDGGTGTQVMQTSAGSSDLAPYKMNSIPPSENAIQAGTVIPATLCTGINSNVDGVVTAVLSYDTYDSLTGNNVLIPAGTKLLGTYDGKAASSSGRVNIRFTQMIFPSGVSYPINPDTFLAMDGAGYSGVKGKVDHHTDKYLSAGAIGAGIAALGSIAAGNVNNSSNTYSAGQLAMQGAMANIINATSSIFQKNANVSDTVTVKPGHTFMIYVANMVQF